MCDSVLRSPGYSNSLLMRLKALYDKGQLCDFCLVANNTELRVHSVVLFSASKFFRGKMEEGSLQEPRFALQTTNSDCLQTLVEFMYTGNLTLSQESVWITLALASQLEIAEVINLCQKFLEGLTPGLAGLQNLGPDSALDLHGVWSTDAEENRTPVPDQEEDLTVATSSTIEAVKQELCDTDLPKSFGLIEEVENANVVSPDESPTSGSKERKQSPRKAKATTRSLEVSDLDISLGSCVLEEVTPRRRGRPKGSKNRPKRCTVEGFTVPRKRGRPRKDGLSPDKMKGSRQQSSTGSAFGHVLRLPHSTSGRHKCDTCGQAYRWHCHLQSHRRLHIDKHLSIVQSQYLLRKALMCSKQKFGSQSREATGKEYRCPHCSKEFKLRTALKCHMLKKHRHNSCYKCQICLPLKTFTCAKYLCLHILRAHRESLNPSSVTRGYWKCSRCSRQFLHRQNLNKHLQAAHSNHGDKLMDTPAKGLVMRTPRKWHCEEDDCDFTSISKRDLTYHISVSHPHTNYSCIPCRFVTNIRAIFRRHTNRFHRNPRESAGKVCDVCGKLFPKMCRLKLHMFSKHKIRDPSLNVYQCSMDGCQYASPFKDGLNRHMIKHQPEKPFTCNICEKHFKTAKSLEKHTNKVHLGIRNFVCDICGMSYGEEAELKIHMARHSDVKTHQCEHCDYATFDKGNYKTHLYGKHGIKLVDDMKIFQCTLCEFNTNTKYRYSDHMRVHYEVRDIPCPHCGKMFMTRKAMRSHIKKVHSPKEFRCDLCSYHTSDKSKLRDHIRVMHTHRNVKPYKCPYCNFQCATGGNCRKHVKHRHKDEEVRYLKLDLHQAAPEDVAMATNEDQPNDSYHDYGNKAVVENLAVSQSLEQELLGNHAQGFSMLQSLGMTAPINFTGTYDNTPAAWQPFVSSVIQGGGHM